MHKPVGVQEADGQAAGTSFIHRFFFLAAKLFSSRREDRTRADPEIPENSSITTLPKEVPIDWFRIEYWNTILTLRERVDYIRGGVRVALPKEEFCATWPQIALWKGLPKEEFMQKYGNAVLAQYKLPTPEEIAQIDEESEDDAQEVEGLVETEAEGSGANA